MVVGIPGGAPSWHAGIALKAAAWRRGTFVYGACNDFCGPGGGPHASRIDLHS